MGRQEARKLIEKLKDENEQWLRATKKASMDGIFSIIERVRVEKRKSFLLELIQNADDCNSSEITFDIVLSKVIVQNDGNPFKSDPDPTKDNILAICKLGRTTKGSEKIGFMGFGFRAVFEVSKNPEIYSGDFSFYFDEDMIVPHWIDDVPTDIKTRLDRMRGRGSIFVLPCSSREICNEVKSALLSISPSVLLYLQHLSSIRIGQDILQMSPGPLPNSFWVYKGSKESKLWKRYYSLPLLIPKELRDFLRKDRNLDRIGKEPKKYEQISITFEIEPNGKIAYKLDNGLYAFLPLADERNTRFGFNIQADFSVDAGRRKLREPESSWNQWLLANVHKCFPFVLEDYKKQGNLRTQFYKILPLEDSEIPEYLKVVKEKLDEYIKTKDSILVKSRKSRKNPDGKMWVKPKYAVIADPEVQRLFDGTDLKHMFGVRKSYVDDEIGYEEMKYVKEIVEDEVSFERILVLLKDHNWIRNRKINGKRHPEKWVGELIIYFANELEKNVKDKSWWTWEYKNEKEKFIKKLSNVKFLLSEEGKIREPEKTFLPSLQNIDVPVHLRRKYSIVNRKLVRYLRGKKFQSEEEKERRERGFKLLKDLCSELSPETVVLEIINPAFSGDNWKKYSDFMLAKYTDFIRKNETIWGIAKIKLKTESKENNREYKDPKELYLSSKYGNEFNLDTLFEGYENVDFVSLGYLSLRPKEKRAKQLASSWKKFLLKMGVKEIPEISEYKREYVTKEEIEKELAYQEDRVMNTYWTYTYPGYAKRDFDFDKNIKDILTDCVGDKVKNPLKRLKILMKILDERWGYYSQYLEAQYGWHADGQFGRSYERLGPSSFAKFLRDSNWIPTREGKNLKPEAVALNELKSIVKAPIVDYKIANKEFKEYLGKLGLQTKPTVEGAIALLKAQVEQKESALAAFVEIYEYLAQHSKEKQKIREGLKDFPCIFIPALKRKYWKISEIFWEGGTCFIDWKTDVKPTYPEYKDFFVNVLDVKEKPTYEDYLEFLRSYLWKKNSLTLAEKNTLKDVYHHLNYVVTTPELKESETWATLKEGFKVWCEDDRWVNTDVKIYYNDNPILYELFKKRTGIYFAYIPDNVNVKGLFAELGIRSLSGNYSERCSIIGEQTVSHECLKCQIDVRRISQYISRFVQEKSPNEFGMLSKEGAFRLLSEVEVRFVEDLEVEAMLDDIVVPLGKRPAFYSWTKPENCLYLRADLKDDEISCFEHIGIAISNAFSRVQGLEFFIPYIAGKKQDEIIHSMGNYGIPFMKEHIEIGMSHVEREIPKPEHEYMPDQAILREQIRSEKEILEHTSAGEYEPVLVKHETLQNLTLEQTRKEWIPEFSPEQVEILSEDYQYDISPTVIDADMVDRKSEKSRSRKGVTITTMPREREILSEEAKIEIGRWGERAALMSIREETMKKYNDSKVTDIDNGFLIEKEGKIKVKVMWLNKNGDQGIGHDIELWENDILYYIEVKSTLAKEKDWFEVSRNQWIFMQEMGDRFYIYRVYGVGTSKPKVVRIRDPAKLWREGNISAYPVRIQL